MKHTIGFRTWDGEDGMIFPSRITFAGSVCYCYVPQADYEYQIDSEYLMQFIGLKDCKGVAIYESDLVRHLNNIYEVKWVCAGFWLVSSELPDLEPTPNVCLDSEVIGNIYQNGDLLK